LGFKKGNILRKGCVPWNKGILRRLETRQKIVEGLEKRFGEQGRKGNA